MTVACNRGGAPIRPITVRRKRVLTMTRRKWSMVAYEPPVFASTVSSDSKPSDASMLT